MCLHTDSMHNEENVNRSKEELKDHNCSVYLNHEEAIPETKTNPSVWTLPRDIRIITGIETCDQMKQKFWFLATHC